MFKTIGDWRKKHFPTPKEKMEAREARYQAYLKSPAGLRAQQAAEEQAKAQAEAERKYQEYQAKQEAKEKERLDTAIQWIEDIEERNKELKGLGLRFYEAWTVPYVIWYKRSAELPPVDGKLIVYATDDDEYFKVYDVNNDYRELDKRVRSLIFTDIFQIKGLFTSLQKVDLDVSDVEFDFSEMVGDDYLQ